MSNPEKKSAYLLGYEASTQFRGGPGAECPYPENSKEADEWWEGFGDSTSDYEVYDDL